MSSYVSAKGNGTTIVRGHVAGKLIFREDSRRRNGSLGRFPIEVMPL